MGVARIGTSRVESVPSVIHSNYLFALHALIIHVLKMITFSELSTKIRKSYSVCFIGHEMGSWTAFAENPEVKRDIKEKVSLVGAGVASTV